MTREECTTALEEIQRRAVRHTNTGGPLQNLAAPRNAATMAELGYYVREARPVQPAPVRQPRAFKATDPSKATYSGRVVTRSHRHHSFSEDK